MIKIETPVSEDDIKNLKIGDKISLNGKMFTGRDAVLPKIANSIENGKVQDIPFNLKGIAIMHTAVSDAGIAPTTSNKIEIESHIHILSEAGVKIHIGKGSLSANTIAKLNESKAIFVITPPVAALLTNCVISKKIVAFEEEGMEAVHELEVKNIPGIIAVAHGKSIF